MCVSTWVFPKIGVPQNGWFIMENPMYMDDLGVPLFSETSTCFNLGVGFFLTWHGFPTLGKAVGSKV